MVGVELRGRVAGIISKFLDEELIAHAQFILRAVAQGERLRAEVLDQLAEHVVGQAVFVGPLGISKYSVERIWIGPLYFSQGILDGFAHVLDLGAGDFPVGILRDLKPVLLGKRGIFLVTA